jgi:hypothetical protein
MTNEGNTRILEAVASTTAVATAERCARALTVGFGLCDEGGFPLNERQRTALLTAALLTFDGFQAETQGTLEVEALLAELARHR